jgi:hypothetical protein
VEVAVGEPETVFDLDIDGTLTLEKGNGTDPIPHLDVVGQSGHFLLLHFIVLAVLGLGTSYFGLRDRRSWTIHQI